MKRKATEDDQQHQTSKNHVLIADAEAVKANTTAAATTAKAATAHADSEVAAAKAAAEAAAEVASAKSAAVVALAEAARVDAGLTDAQTAVSQAAAHANAEALKAKEDVRAAETEATKAHAALVDAISADAQADAGLASARAAVARSTAAAAEQSAQERLDIERFMADVVDKNLAQFKQQVKLNVGGEKFETTLGTLTRYPDSMLGAMFSGRHELTPDSEGYVFIDRDGTHFRTILNFLRTGVLDVPRCKELTLELEFYQLREPPSATNIVRPKIVTTRYLVSHLPQFYRTSSELDLDNVKHEVLVGTHSGFPYGTDSFFTVASNDGPVTIGVSRNNRMDREGYFVKLDSSIKPHSEFLCELHRDGTDEKKLYGLDLYYGKFDGGDAEQKLFGKIIGYGVKFFRRGDAAAVHEEKIRAARASDPALKIVTHYSHTLYSGKESSGSNPSYEFVTVLDVP